MKTLFFLLAIVIATPVLADDKALSCPATDNICVLNDINKNANQIENPSWRDKVYRELAKAYTYNGDVEAAISLIDKIQKPDTKAMTIRGIGFAAADSKWEDTEKYTALFLKLNAKAVVIEDPSAHGIALTYIAMSQALAGDDMGATLTTNTMTNAALRNKAFAESAEIQAEAGRYQEATASIAYIDSEAFRNKAYALISKIMAKQDNKRDSYHAAMQITNPYMRSETLLNLVNHDNPEERAR